MMHPGTFRAAWAALLCVLLVGLAAPTETWAKKGFSSGGYGRPASSWGSRTPSTQRFSTPRPRTPSTSGGYGRPPAASSTTAPPPIGGTDRAMARQSSRQALDAFRAGQRTPPTTPSAPSAPATGTWGGADGGAWTSGRRPSYRDFETPRHALGRPAGGAPPAPVAGGQAQAGPWGALLLWGLLESLSRPGNAEFFYHHAEDPRYKTWRAEADAQARDAPELKRKLEDLDTRLAGMGGPRDPQYSPPEARTPADPAEGGFPFTALFLLVALAFLLYLAWRKFFSKDSRGERDMWGSSGRDYRPNWFRVGMTLPVDPSLFILAAPHASVQAPEAATASGFLSVESLGEAVCAELTWYRLYVSGGRSFFQVHLDDRGQPDECRYFSLLDEVAPADEAEWGFWLDDQEGMIGWPEFQTKDGRLYQRLWAQGGGRSPPRAIHETLREATGAPQIRRQQAMLYGRATGAVAPAPATEYLLVSAMEQEEAAWVSLHAGIDVSVSALQLS